jgi:hypothetical protein
MSPAGGVAGAVSGEAKTFGEGDLASEVDGPSGVVLVGAATVALEVTGSDDECLSPSFMMYTARQNSTEQERPKTMSISLRNTRSGGKCATLWHDSA